MRRLKTEILVQMEGVDPTRAERRVLLVGATNRPEELDEAARRRMPKQLYIPLPDAGGWAGRAGAGLGACWACRACLGGPCVVCWVLAGAACCFGRLRLKHTLRLPACLSTCPPARLQEPVRTSSCASWARAAPSRRSWARQTCRRLWRAHRATLGEPAQHAACQPGAVLGQLQRCLPARRSVKPPKEPPSASNTPALPCLQV